LLPHIFSHKLFTHSVDYKDILKMEQGTQAFITPHPVVAEFDPSLANLKSKLNGWIGGALRTPDIAAGLRTLCEQLEAATLLGLLSLPNRFRAAQPDHYARRLVYADPATGVSVIAMVWAPGQSTPLHDHSGLWGVEAVLSGEIESVPFDLIGQQNEQYTFRAGPVERVPKGSTSYLIPPFEHHMTRNVSNEVAISLNIYGGEMQACNIFLPTGSGTYSRQRRVLSYSD
jgi:3-mercaptopropionate dioxygenase